MPTYFTLHELCKSGTADVLGIDNFPTFEIVENLENLSDSLLDPIRVAWGSAIRVSSGYRCKKLNDAVGGVVSSAHLRGDAADIVPANGRMSAFKEFIWNWAMKSKAKFDQIILEKDKRGNEWVHVSLKSSTGAQRGELFKLVK